MHVDKLKYYIDLYDCRSFTETAKKNFISQAALSQFISSLEKQFGLVFFNRNVTPIEPTVAGSRFYEESKILYRQYENMLNEMTRIKEDVLPPLRIAYSSTVDIQALLPYIPVFKEKYPNAELQLNKIKLKEA
ncbi:MAG: LysR family transcriptional regulator, partial [Pseudobutyrivibrio sp.]|nr:LysR family transcriptional regulator [Pseudobutyrivibrio sp.]